MKLKKTLKIKMPRGVVRVVPRCQSVVYRASGDTKKTKDLQCGRPSSKGSDLCYAHGAYEDPNCVIRSKKKKVLKQTLSKKLAKEDIVIFDEEPEKKVKKKIFRNIDPCSSQSTESERREIWKNMVFWAEKQFGQYARYLTL